MFSRTMTWLVVALCALGSAQAKPWLYQLQNPVPAQIGRSGFPAAVIDYSRDGTDATRLRPAQMAKLARQGVTALSYLSIGEAENYRFYWNRGWEARTNSNERTALAPSWLGETNPDWVGNYKVRYWDPDWRTQVLQPYLDRILQQRFRGVYLDIIDAFEYWSDPASYGPKGETYQAGDPIGDKAEAARRMIDLVVWIADYTRARSAHFLVYPQNAEEIFLYDQGGLYKRTISGQGSEDVFYDATTKQPPNETNYRLRFLRELKRAGKPVLCVDYVDDGTHGTANEARIRDFVARCQAEGFDFYAARKNRALDQINLIPGIQP